MKRAALATALGCAVLACPAMAALTFADFFAYDPITAFDFGYRARPPVVEIAYVRSGVGDRFTDITVTLDDPHFRILGHSCPATLANGRSCMVFFTFDPQGHGLGNGSGDGVFRARLDVISNEASASLAISGHRNSRHCADRGLPLTPRCWTPAPQHGR